MRLDQAASVVLGAAAAVNMAVAIYLGVGTWTLAPAFIAIALAASLRLPPALRIQVASMLIATIAALYAVEIFLARSAVVNFPPRLAAQKAGVPFDSRTKLEVVRDLRARGDSALPVVHGRLLRMEGVNGRRLSIVVDGEEKMPLSGPSHRTVVACNETGEYLIYRSDERGFHNPPGAWNGDIQVATVGDSFTHGACVPTEEGLAGKLRAQGLTALNLGLDGNGPLAMAATVREYLPAVEPRAVIWVYYEGNDLADFEEELESPTLLHYLEPEFRQQLRESQQEISRQLVAFLEVALADELRASRTETLKLARLRTSIGLRGFRRLDGRRPVAEDACCHIDLLEQVLRQTKAEVEEWGGTLYFVYLPTWRRYFIPAEMTAPEMARDQVLEAVGRMGIELIDVHEVFMKKPDPGVMYSYPGAYAHFSPAGYAAVAESIAGVLRR